MIDGPCQNLRHRVLMEKKSGKRHTVEVSNVVIGCHGCSDNCVLNEHTTVYATSRLGKNLQWGLGVTILLAQLL